MRITILVFDDGSFDVDINSDSRVTRKDDQSSPKIEHIYNKKATSINDLTVDERVGFCDQLLCLILENRMGALFDDEMDGEMKVEEALHYLRTDDEFVLYERFLNVCQNMSELMNYTVNDYLDEDKNGDVSN